MRIEIAYEELKDATEEGITKLLRELVGNVYCQPSQHEDTRTVLVYVPTKELTPLRNVLKKYLYTDY